jgi:prepilin-type N-terminal cleavage/methylation domain-containing protein
MTAQTHRIARRAAGRARGGFTLVELLVVIAIIAVLAALSIMISGRFIDSGRKVQALAQFRDFEIGLKSYEVDYNRPPIPESKRPDGDDTMYGDPGGLYSNSILVAVLAGSDGDFPAQGTSEIFNAREINPRQEVYLTFAPATDGRNGVGADGKLYDPWGREVIVVVNGMKGERFARIIEGVGSTPGKNDTHLETWNYGAYSDTRPREQSFVFFSYGRDGLKGKGAENFTDIVPYAGSDDVISW